MKEDFEGFLYPMVSVDKCVQCGLCNRACPIENKDYDMQKAMQEEWKVKSVVMRTKSRDVLMGSTSGGFFTPFAEYIKKQQGVIFAAAYDQDFNVRHLSWGGKQQYTS